MEINNILTAFGLTLFAGLATGIGSALAFFTKKTNTKFLSIALGNATNSRKKAIIAPKGSDKPDRKDKIKADRRDDGDGGESVDVLLGK